MKKLVVISFIALAGIASYIFQDWLYDKYLDIRYGRTTVFFSVDAEGNWQQVKSKRESDFYRNSWVDEKNRPVGHVKAYYSKSDAIYWIGKAKTLDPFVPDGICTTFFEDGSTKELVRYKNGLLNGEYWEFYYSGQVKFSGRYRAGEADSACVSYYPNGALEEWATFEGGRLHGYFAQYDTSELKKYTGEYFNNVPDGTHTSYHSGLIKSQVINYNKGELHGYYAEFDSAGNNLITGNYRNGLAHGVFFVDGDEDVPNELFLNDTLMLVDVFLDQVWKSASESEIRLLSQMINTADSLFNTQQYEGALAGYREILRLYPNLEMAKGKRGETYFELASISDESYYGYAASDIIRAVGIKDNRDYWRHYLMAMCKYYTGDLDNAFQWFDIATMTIPKDENGATLRGICYNQMGKIHMEKYEYQEALNMYSKAIEVTQDRPDFYLGRAWAHFKLGNSDSSLYDCVEAINLDIETDEERAEVYSLMAILHYDEGELADAEYWVSSALKSNPSDPYSVYLFQKLYPGINSESVNASFGQLLAGISVGLIFWEAAAVYRLLMAGRFLGAATEIAGSAVIGAGLDGLTGTEEGTKNITIRNSKRSQRRKFSNLRNASIVTALGINSIENRVNQAQQKYVGGRNYQGVTKYRNTYYILAGGYEERNFNYYQKYHKGKEARDVWDQFIYHHNYVFDQVFLERIDYLDGKWQFVSSAHSDHDHKAQIIIDDKFPKEQILQAWSEKMKIMDIDYGNRDWVVTLRNDCVDMSWFHYIKQQFVQVSYEFPEELIKAYWERGYFISKLKFIDNKWLLLMEEYKWNSDVVAQRVLVENFFPIDRAYEHEQIGFNLQSISHGRGLWAVVVTKKE